MVEDAVSGAEFSPCLLALAVVCLPLCLWQGERPVHSWLALLWYSLNPLFCERAQQCPRLELVPGKFSLSLILFSLSLAIPHFGLLFMCFVWLNLLHSQRMDLVPRMSLHQVIPRRCLKGKMPCPFSVLLKQVCTLIICLTWTVAKVNAREMLLYLTLCADCISNNLTSSVIYFS